MSTSRFLEFVLILSTCLLSAKADYYWKPWTQGSAPDNAVTGKDYRGTSYVVQATIPKWGDYIGQAFIGQTHINITALNGTLIVAQSSGSLKVLCTDDQTKLAWYPSYKTTLDNELLTGVIAPAVGGLAINGQVVYIGKYLNYNGRTVHFGSIISSDHRILYSYNNVNYNSYYFEILVVNQRCSDK